MSLHVNSLSDTGRTLSRRILHCIESIPFSVCSVNRFPQQFCARPSLPPSISDSVFQRHRSPKTPSQRRRFPVLRVFRNARVSFVRQAYADTPRTKKEFPFRLNKRKEKLCDFDFYSSFNATDSALSPRSRTLIRRSSGSARISLASNQRTITGNHSLSRSRTRRSLCG